MTISIKSFKCNRCGYIKEYCVTPALPKQKNIIAADCPICFFGQMEINTDDELNFNDDYIITYFGGTENA